MAYSEKDGQVVLTMSRDDYENLMLALGMATGAAFRIGNVNNLVRLVNRLNQGNPHFTPYDVPPEKKSA